MMIRKAEPRDIPAIIAMFYKLLAYLEDCGQKLYARDRRKFENGVVGFIVGKLFHEDSLVLVGVDEKDDPVGFLIGGLRPMEAFFENDLIGEIQWHYPLSLNTRQFARELEKWAAGRGATASLNYHTPGNEAVAKMFAHDGRTVAWHIYIRQFEKPDIKVPALEAAR